MGARKNGGSTAAVAGLGFAVLAGSLDLTSTKPRQDVSDSIVQASVRGSVTLDACLCRGCTRAM